MSTLNESKTNGVSGKSQGALSAVLHRSLHEQPLKVVSSDGLYLFLDNGQRILDATGGAAVACLGHNDAKVKKAMLEQINSVTYCHSLFYSTDAAEQLCRLLAEGTNGQMTRAFIVSSGSEAMESCIKMARQYFVELEGKDTKRTRFIARKQSYHGTTMGVLGIGGHVMRRDIYEPMLASVATHMSPCYAYRGMKVGETESQYVQRLAEELDDEFHRLGPDTVCAFVAERVVGAALGCVPALPGYFKAVKEVCDKHGALLVLDEIMSGMGRSGYLHVWQSPTVDVVPDLQAIGKGLGGGYAPVAAMLVSQKVVNVLEKGTGAFAHGQTYQGHPVSCATALSVQKIVKEEALVQQVQKLGMVLEDELRSRLEDVPYVGDIRGMGLFWGVEFVKNRNTKEPFDPQLLTATNIHNLGMQEPFSISLYPCSGVADGRNGDCILVAPPFTCSEGDIRLIAKKTASVIKQYFETNFNSTS